MPCRQTLRIAASPAGSKKQILLSEGWLEGEDGSFFNATDSLKANHPAFPEKVFAFHTITNTWFQAGSLPENHVTTQAVKWDNGIVILSLEMKPHGRSQLWKTAQTKNTRNFGIVDWSAIVLYLLILAGMGVFFSFRNKNTEDFFRAGQRIPWWAAGCSIFATMLSSITYLSIPAKAYATDWVYFILNMAIVALAPFIILYILPFFRKINAISAYEYLEKRFNLSVRLFASASYILFQVGRIAIVMFLPALAFATFTPVSVETWIILLRIDNGFAGFFHTAVADHKFRLINWDWSMVSITTTALWVVVLGGLAQQLIPYTSDQGIVQRYMSISSEKKAAKAIWTNAGLSLFSTVLFFGVGTALYVFYKNFPSELLNDFIY